MQEKAPAREYGPVLLCCLPAQSRGIYCGLSRGSGLLPPVEDLPDSEHILRHSELHLPAAEGKTVHPVRVVLIGGRGSWASTPSRAARRSSSTGPSSSGDTHPQAGFLGLAGKAAAASGRQSA